MQLRAAQNEASQVPYLRLVTELEYVDRTRPVVSSTSWLGQVRGFLGSLLRDYPIDEPHTFWP